MVKIKTQIAIVGTGAGGAMVAQELARAGKDVVMIERGPDMATFAEKEELELARDLYQEEGRYPRTEEGYAILRGLNVGGTTELAIGHGVRAFEEDFKSLGIDLREAFEETEAELGVTPMPREHIGPNAALLTQAAEALNMEITTWNKFIDFDRCTHCGRCVITCPIGAKWSSNQVIKKLRNRDNVFLLSKAMVTRIHISGGRATGVVCETAKGALEIIADDTILCAGGLGTPVILQKSGIEAGGALFLDIFPIVYGRSALFQADPEPSMPTIFNEHRECGYVLSPHVDVALMFQGIKGWFGDRPPYGIMVKTSDDNEGRVDAQGRVFKHLTKADRWRLSAGEREAKKILMQIGVKPDDITVSGLVGGHPGGTAAIGDVVDPDLACKTVKSLYVCDASVFQRSPGRPPIVTICALAKWLGRSLLQ
jgi:choline dehydrogenase-like flavoprotein